MKVQKTEPDFSPVQITLQTAQEVYTLRKILECIGYISRQADATMPDKGMYTQAESFATKLLDLLGE